MIDLRFRPLPEWNRQPGLQRRDCKFKRAYPKILDLLEREILHLRGTDIMVEAGFTLNQLRNDGWPYSSASPSHPGVVVYFKSKGRDLSFPCGTFKTMEHNLCAIGLTLEHLRAIERYGAVVDNQQYSGFLALPPAAPNFASLRLSAIVGYDITLRTSEKDIRALKQLCHPDKNGGDRNMWDLLEQALKEPAFQ